MRTEEIVDLLEKNYQLIGETNAKWLDKRVKYRLARIFSGKRKLLSVEEFNWLDTALSRKSGLFTSLTRISRHTLAGVMLANQKNSVDIIEELYYSKTILKKSGFKSSSSTYFAAYQLLFTKADKREVIAGRAFKIYQTLKKKHPFITNLNDYSSVVSLAQSEALSTHSETEVCEIVEFYFDNFRKVGFKNNENCLVVSILTTLVTAQKDAGFIQVFVQVLELFEERKLKVKSSYFVSLVTITYLQYKTNAVDFDELVVFVEEISKSISLIFEAEYRQALGISLYAEELSKKLVNGSLSTITVAWNQLIVEEQTILVSNATTFIEQELS